MIAFSLNNRLAGLLCLAILPVVMGCGAGEPAPGESVAEQQTNQDIEHIRGKIEEIAKHGNVSYSDLYGLDESLKNAGKPELIEDLNKIGTAKNPDEAKKLALAFLDKL